ncbi:MAG: class I SAM-dependent methyltransferase [Planctomycetaceae bacterium]|jgi:hypothetical protein
MSSTEFNQPEFDLAYPPGVEFNSWTVARHHILGRALARRRWLEGVWLAGEWLAVGCGRGIVLQFLRARGLEVRGVELALAERSRPGGVLLLDVIEHLPDPVAFLQRLRESLPNVRRWVITVPAHPALWSKNKFYGHPRRSTACRRPPGEKRPRGISIGMTC